ncbi:MAG: hypothetical protein ABSD78_20160 [Acidimicrobiales bacterium]|jgi:hypothetical protein
MIKMAARVVLVPGIALVALTCVVAGATAGASATERPPAMQTLTVSG